MTITAETTALQLAALVSQALESAGVTATLSGGGAVSLYTDNEYASKDLDFVTSARRGPLAEALRPLGFTLASDRRHFAHPATDLFVEFPAGPLAFGDTVVAHEDVPTMQTPWGALRVITATLCAMDRLAAFWHWNDRQSWDQAVMVVRRADVDRSDLVSFAKQEGADGAVIDGLYENAGR